MKVLELGTDLDLDGPGATSGTALDLADGSYAAPFLPNYTVIAVGVVVGYAEDAEGALTIEGREATADSYVVLFTAGPGAAPLKMAEITLQRFIRYTLTSATAADGRGSVYLLGN